MPRIDSAARSGAGTVPATQARRVLKAATRVRRAPAARPGGLRDDLVGQHRAPIRRGLHAAPDREGAAPVLWRGRQCHGQAGQPRRSGAGHLRPDTYGHATFLLHRVNDLLLIVMLAWCRSGGVTGSVIGGVMPYPVFTLTDGDGRHADRAGGGVGAHRGLRHHDPPAGRANGRPLRPGAPSWQL